MKIFELHYSTSWAGAERFVVDLCNELTEKNDVILCTIENDRIPQKSYYKKELNSNIKYINLKCQSGLQLKALWRIYKTIKKEKPDIVHAHTDAICLFLPVLFYHKPIYFHTLHNLAEKCIRKLYLRKIYKWFYKYYINPITISQICDNSYQELYGLTNAIHINNGRSPLKITSKINNVKQELSELKLHQDDKIFIHIARCQPQKNQILLIKAFNKFLSEKNHGILVMIGAAYDTSENKPLLENANKGIYWIGLRNNICDYLLHADFFILSSLYEGLPISLLEALACGVIPICTPAGGIPDVIKDDSLGFISKDFTLSSFYDCLIKAYNTTNKIDTERLKAYFNNNYSMKHCAELYAKTFQQNVSSIKKLSKQSKNDY